MRIHPREEPVRKAERDLQIETARILRKYNLTEAEGLRVVNAVLSDHIAGVAKYAIREERHGDADTPGGLA